MSNTPISHNRIAPSIEQWGDLLRTLISPESIRFFRNVARRKQNHKNVKLDSTVFPIGFNSFEFDGAITKVGLHDLFAPEITLSKMFPDGTQFDIGGIMYDDDFYAIILEKFHRNSGGFLVARRKVVLTNVNEMGIYDGREDYNPYLSDRGDLPTDDYTGQLIEYFYRPDGTYKSEGAMIKVATDGQRFTRKANADEQLFILHSTPPDKTLIHSDFFVDLP